MSEAQGCEQLAQGCYAAALSLRNERITSHLRAGSAVYYCASMSVEKCNIKHAYIGVLHVHNP